MNIEVTVNRNDEQLGCLKKYANQRMVLLKQRFPKVSEISVCISRDAKRRIYTAEVTATRLGMTAVGAKDFSRNGKRVIDSAAARAERQLLRLRQQSWRETIQRHTPPPSGEAIDA